MSLQDDLKQFLQAHDKISQTRQNLQNDINLPEFDVQDSLAEVTATAIINANPGVFNVSNLLTLKASVNAGLSASFNKGNIGASKFFDSLKDIANMNFLFNAEGVFDFIRPLADDLGFSVNVGITEVNKLSSLVTNFNTFIQATPRVRLDSITNTVLGSQKDAILALRDKVTDINNTFITKGAVVEADRVDAINDLDILFNSVTSADEVMPEIERQVREITAQGEVVKTCMQDCINKKVQSETFVDNFVNDIDLVPYQKQTFASAENLLTSLSGTVDAVINVDNQFKRVNVQSTISAELQATKSLLNALPSNISATISAAVHKPIYDTFKGSLNAIATLNLQAVIDQVDKVVQKTQTTVVRDILSDYSTTSAAFTTLLGDTATDLGSISSAVQTYVPASTEIGKKVDQTVVDSEMDRMQRVLTEGGFTEFGGMVANDATEAGKVAQSLAEEIVLIPEFEGGKKIAYELARNIMVGLHQTQLITARAIRQEVPGAVSQLSSQDQEVQRALDLINQFE